MKEFKVGDEVWVRGCVAQTNVKEVGVALHVHTSYEWFRVPSEMFFNIRTDDDFVNPLDKAIVDAAMEWHGSANINNELALETAVMRRENAERPKTAEEVVKEARSNAQLCGCSDVDEEIVNALRSAGLLKEEAA